MQTQEFYTGQEVAELLALPVIVTELADGTVKAERAGIAAVGTNAREAATVWGREFAEIIRRPKT